MGTASIPEPGTSLDEQIGVWRAFVAERDTIGARDLDELEDHVRGQVERLRTSGLSDDEAFLVAVRRIGRIDDLSREFARVHSERLWKQLVLAEDGSQSPRTRSTLLLALGLAVGAGLAVKVPALFGYRFGSSDDFYATNLALLILPFAAAFFLITRRAGARTVSMVATPFVALALVLNLYPFADDGMTAPLAVIHSIVALWIVVGIAYADGDIRSSRARMDFIRFSGEWFVYMVLIALGGGVLIALTMGVFGAIGIDASSFTGEWLLPCGVAGATVIATWLVEAKQSVVENIAPVLTKLFTPLFTLLLLAFLVAGLSQGLLVEPAADGPQMFGQSDLLVLFDAVLLVVLALLLYSLSARDAASPAGWFDRLQLLLVLAALAVDALVLVAMIGRIAEYGASANKLASLGLNLILLANLLGAAWLQGRFSARRIGFDRLERWQTSFVPVYFGWAVIVAVVFPPVFDFA